MSVEEVVVVVKVRVVVRWVMFLDEKPICVVGGGVFMVVVALDERTIPPNMNEPSSKLGLGLLGESLLWRSINLTLLLLMLLVSLSSSRSSCLFLPYRVCACCVSVDLDRSGLVDGVVDDVSRRELRLM
jgi:hypothetical protein